MAVATEANTKNYWISSTALYITLNAMGEPDYLQCSVASGAAILCYIPGIDDLGYDAGHNYQRWSLSAYPSKLSGTGKRYVYAAIPRPNTNVSGNAMIVFPGQQIDIYGKSVLGEGGTPQQIGDERYYYIFLQGIISEVKVDSDGQRRRDWDQHINTGSLATDEAIASGGEGSWWSYNGISDSISFLKTILKANFENLDAKTAKIAKLLFGDKELNGVADENTLAVSTDKVVTPHYLEMFGNKHFLSKLKDDSANGIITFLKGLKFADPNAEITADGLARLFAFMTYGFESGLTGTGASIDHKGNAELNSLFVRQFISTPKFTFNEVNVTKAEQWNTNGFGTIESVDTEKRQITLHLEENDYGSLQVGDICRGIFADIDNAYGSDSNVEGSLDENNFVVHKGFFTTYFYVSRIIASERGRFVFQYGKKSPSTPDPCAFMDFAQYGSFNDESRQSSMYFSSRGRSYIEVLEGVRTWEILPQNRVCRYGYLGGLSLLRKDGTYVYPEGNGIYCQDNVYFGGTVNYLGNIAGVDSIVEEAKNYDVSLSQYQSVLTIDDMGNVINGLYTVDDNNKNIKQYRVSTAVFVRKGNDILLEEDDSNEDVTAGHYRLHCMSDNCDVIVKNSTVFVKGIKNVKDGVAGSDDDTDFDYDAMRSMTDAMITIVVDLEGKTTKLVQMPIRIQHDSLPFMVCDLSNENASVAWNTKTNKYIGLPVTTKVSLMYKNEAYPISYLGIGAVNGLKPSVSIDGNAKVITIDADGISSDILAQVTKLPITVVGEYAGARYEYTKELTLLKSSDTVVYEIVPSVDSVKVDKGGNTSVSSISCDVYATSSDDKRYKIDSLPHGFWLGYSYDKEPTSYQRFSDSVAIDNTRDSVTLALFDASGNLLDKETVPVLKDGDDGLNAPKASVSDDILTIPTDSAGKVLANFEETIRFSLMVLNRECSSLSVVLESGQSDDVAVDVNGSSANISCQEDTTLGVNAKTLRFKVTGSLDGKEYIDYVNAKVLPNVTGADGDGYEFVYYMQNNEEAPSAPSRTDGVLTSGWVNDPIAPTITNQFIFVAFKVGKLGSDGAFSTPKLFNRFPKSINNEVKKYYTSSSGTTAPSIEGSGWSESMPSDFNDTYPWLWQWTHTVYTDNSTADSVVCLGYKAKDGNDGAGQVCAYKFSDDVPTSKPTTSSFDNYKNNNNQGNGWTKNVPVIGTVSNVSYNNDTYLGNWERVYHDGNYWYKSPSSGQEQHNETYKMKIYFTTSVDNQNVAFYLRAYSEANFDFVILSDIDSETIDRTDGNAHKVSGNNVDSGAIILTCGTAGRHFVTVGYAKDGSASQNGDYGLVRLETNNNGILYRCDGTVFDSIITWGDIYQMQGDKGDPGNQGTSVVGVTTYYVISSYNNVSGVVGSSNWSTTPSQPTKQYPYLWSYTDTELDNGEHITTTPTIVGYYTESITGPRGSRGALPRTHAGAEKGSYTYLQGADNEAYVDIVRYNDTWYRCVMTHTTSSPDFSNTTYWEESQAKGWTFLATELLLAENARIDMMSSQEINLLDDNSNIFGSFRHVGNNEDYALWLGGNSGESASFAVTRGGKLKATGAEITGTVNATSGRIGNITLDSEGLNASTRSATLNDNVRYGVMLRDSALWVGYHEMGMREVAIGKMANQDLLKKDSYGLSPYQSASDMFGNLSTSNILHASMIVRKYTLNANIGMDYNNPVNDPAYAALHVDTDEGIGIRSIGGNLLGGLALGLIKTSSLTDSQKTAINNNRVGILVLTNSDSATVGLPTSPITGQIFIIIRQTGNVTVNSSTYIYVPDADLKKSVSSTAKYEWMVFAYDGSFWRMAYLNK